MKPYTVNTALALLRGDSVNFLDQDDFIIRYHPETESFIPMPPEGLVWAGNWGVNGAAVVDSVGWRPMAVGEIPEPGDEYLAYGHLPFLKADKSNLCESKIPLSHGHTPFRTKRPLDLSKIVH